ncbi:SpaH/EbpB family LPXTG-anchored major pilin [Lacticaseibacillus nasuensis]|uniref:Uncharacterized protein n=1 Tax=Lacticaseibacillus nasuensis JCM 17158 TaxID=1291734 RepID=A0A0R1JRI4_9LACO|nr:SpaH/EbpB family LPXTG-anchored major pilin [Lacticaseibacillus nasuensis]KRK71028.1 hypothetical protein FD02_GL000212 [Lacticaseibacillus nasuensis JCM 17158]
MNKAKLGHVIGVCGLALGALGAVATPAFTRSTPSSVTASTVEDDTTMRSITLHKYAGTPATSGDNSKVPDASDVPTGAKALGGISFKITKVAKVAGKTLSASDTSSYTTDASFAAQTVTTDDKGTAKADLGAGTTGDGYYLVVEQPSDAVKTAAAPFIVHVPLTTTDASTNTQTLTYDVNIFPKNEIDEANLQLNPTKTLFDDGKEVTADSVKTGSTVYWDMTINRPADIHGSGVETEGTTETSAPDKDGNTVTTTTTKWKTYASELNMVDVLDTTKMGDAKITKVVISSPSTSDPTKMVSVPLTEDTDYKVTTEEDTTNKTNTVTVSLTAAGIAKFAAADKGSKLVATLSTTVNAQKDAEVSNTFKTNYKGTITPDQTQTQTTVPDQKPTVYFGNIDADKTDEDGKAVPDAVFTLYSDADAKTPVTDKDGNTLTAKSDANGKVEFTGLEVDPDTKTQKYYLVETDAPAGYDVDGKIHEVTATQDSTPDVTVVDHDNMLPNLPLTGSQARILFYAMTTGLIVVGAAGVYIIKRRQNA